MGHLKAAIFDISDTTLTKDSRLQPGMEDVINQFQAWGIEVFFASNRQRECARFQRIFPVAANRLLWIEKVGGAKGTGAFVRAVCQTLSIEPHNLIYLGDGDKDLYESVNNDVILFLPQWAQSPLRYGIPVPDTQSFLDAIRTFFLKDTLWYYQLADVDNLNRSVVARALLDPDKAREAGITDFLKSKGVGGPARIHGYKTIDYLSLHLIASIYLEGLHRTNGLGKAIWCIYPSSDQTYTNSLSTFSFFISRLFSDYFLKDLILRHHPSIKSSASRKRGIYVDITNQLNTIHLNPEYERKIQGRQIIVVDDFTTYSQAFETARNMLLKAGANSVIGVAVGKYGYGYTAYSPVAGVNWNSFAPCQLAIAQFSNKALHGATDANALNYF